MLRFLLTAIAVCLLAPSASAQVVTLPPGDYTVHSTGTTTITPVLTPPTCSGNAPATTQHNACVAPLTGLGWDQTRTVTCTGSPPAWQVTPWVPATMPSGACNPPTTFNWQSPKPPSQFVMPAKPARGSSFVTAYGTTVTRVTDHAVDIGGQTWLREDYSRRQSLNANDSMLAVYEPDGGWNVYNTATNQWIKHLSGPGADAEIQWDPLDPDLLYYLDTNGGTVLRRLHVSTNTRDVQYDFGADAKAALHLASTPVHCWTKSEGSPSADNSRWGLQCEDSSFRLLGYVVLDTVNKRVVWSQASTLRPDSVSMTPSGRWFYRSGSDADGSRAINIATGQVRQLLTTSQHADLGVLPNGDDFFFSCDYSAAGDGWCFVIDIDTGVRTNTLRLYNNPWVDTDYAVHISAKAFKAPGWVILGTYQSNDNKSNLVLINVVSGQVYGLSTFFVQNGNYWDEPHAFANRTLTKVYYNDNFAHTLTGDVYRVDVPALPVGGAISVQPAQAMTAAKTANPIVVRRKKPTIH